MIAPVVSIIVPSYNDPDIGNTIQSVFSSIPDAARSLVEVVVVDDCTSRPVEAPLHLPVTVVRNSRRIGCGPSRYVGACHAAGDLLFFVDSHCRFSDYWIEVVRREAEAMEPGRIICGSCVALGEDMDLAKPLARYYAADFNFCGPYRTGPKANNPKFEQVMECVWAGERSGTTYPVQAIMGACYLIGRSHFFQLDALRSLRIWGSDEIELSLKNLLAGGENVLVKDLVIGHRFRAGTVPPSFKMLWHELYNKLWVMHTCLPPSVAKVLQAHLGAQRDGRYGGQSQFNLALKKIHEDWHLVETQRAVNAGQFRVNFESLCRRFGINLPLT